MRGFLKIYSIMSILHKWCILPLLYYAANNNPRYTGLYYNFSFEDYVTEKYET